MTPSKMKTKQMLTKTVKKEMATTKPAKKSMTMSYSMTRGAAAKSKGKMKK